MAELGQLLRFLVGGDGGEEPEPSGPHRRAHPRPGAAADAGGHSRNHTQTRLADGQVSFSELVDGYAAAYDRLLVAAQGRNESAARAALFEALNWAVSIDDAVRERWAPAGEPLGFKWRDLWSGAAPLQGLRTARNHVHHQWADAVRLDDGGRGYPRRYPLRYFHFVWRDQSELPAALRGHRPEDDAAYREHLEGQPVEVALRGIKSVFEHLIPLLEPPRPQRAVVGGREQEPTCNSPDR